MAALLATVVTDQIAAVAAILAGLVAITILTNKIYQMIRRIDEAIGVDDKGRTLSQRLEAVEHQLWPNGGGSLNDKVTRIAHRQKKLIGQIEEEWNLRISEGDDSD